MVGGHGMATAKSLIFGTCPYCDTQISSKAVWLEHLADDNYCTAWIDSKRKERCGHCNNTWTQHGYAETLPFCLFSPHVFQAMTREEYVDWYWEKYASERP